MVHRRPTLWLAVSLHVLLCLCLFACHMPGAKDEGGTATRSSSSKTGPDGKKWLTLEKASGPKDTVRFSASPPDYRWSDDGKFLVRRERGKSVGVDPTTFAETPMKSSDGSASRQKALEKAFSNLEGFDADRAKRAASSARRSLSSSDGDEPVLVDFGEELYVYRPDEGRVTRLTDNDGDEKEAELSPDNASVAYVLDNDLYIADSRTGAARRITEGGGPELFHGRLDWVYQEEIYACEVLLTICSIQKTDPCR